jgi:hypothetical protein
MPPSSSTTAAVVFIFKQYLTYVGYTAKRETAASNIPHKGTMAMKFPIHKNV